MIDVQGFCPMGCGETLFLGEGGFVTCSFLHCPAPTGVSDVLNERETEHLVRFDATGWAVEHPLRERIESGSGLIDCALTDYCAALDGPPVREGTYRATRSGAAWQWTPVGSAS